MLHLQYLEITRESIIMPIKFGIRSLGMPLANYTTLIYLPSNFMRFRKYSATKHFALLKTDERRLLFFSRPGVVLRPPPRSEGHGSGLVPEAPVTHLEKERLIIFYFFLPFPLSSRPFLFLIEKHSQPDFPRPLTMRKIYYESPYSCLDI